MTSAYVMANVKEVTFFSTETQCVYGQNAKKNIKHDGTVQAMFLRVVCSITTSVTAAIITIDLDQLTTVTHRVLATVRRFVEGR